MGRAVSRLSGIKSLIASPSFTLPASRLTDAYRKPETGLVSREQRHNPGNRSLMT